MSARQTAPTQPEPSTSPGQCVLSRDEYDDLEERLEKILRNSALIQYVLDRQNPKAPNDHEDQPLLTIIRESLTELVYEIHIAARESAAIVDRDQKTGGA